MREINPFHTDIKKALKTIEQLPEPWPRPVLVLMSGLPGTGKSYLARRLAERVPMAIISTDAVRLALVRRPTYTWLESRRVYAVCHQIVDDLLAKGVPTIFDATNLIEQLREVVYQIAEKHNAKLIVVETTAPGEMVQKRMEGRALGEDESDKSEADLAVYLKMQKTAEPIRRDHFTVDTSQDIESALDRIIKATRN